MELAPNMAMRTRRVRKHVIFVMGLVLVFPALFACKSSTENHGNYGLLSHEENTNSGIDGESVRNPRGDEAGTQGLESPGPELYDKVVRLLGRGYSSDPDASGKIDAAYLSIPGGKLKSFVDCQIAQSNDPYEEFLLRGPYLLESVSNHAMPESLVQTIGEKSLCRLLVYFGPHVAADLGSSRFNSDEMNGKTILIRGFTPTHGIEFSISTSRKPILLLESIFEEGFLPVEKYTNLILAFDQAKWFQELDMDSLPVRGRTITIDDENYPNIVDTVLKNIFDSSALYFDANDNGELDQGEIDAHLLAVPTSISQFK